MRTRSAWVAVLIAFVALIVAPAAPSRAQCGHWETADPSSGIFGTVYALAVHDFDGAGPELARLVVGGDFQSLAGFSGVQIASFDGRAWRPMRGLSILEVRAIVSHDADGPGPLPAELIIGGRFQDVGNSGVAVWDGERFRIDTLRGWDLYGVEALASYDPDGPGAALPQLIAAGAQFGRQVARWNGSAWVGLGTGVNRAVHALTVWDPDGEGPMSPQLIAAGEFSMAGGAPAARVARWDGAAWWPMGAGFDIRVFALAVFDPDGDGPLPARPIAGGQFTSSGGTPLSNIAQWDGAAWAPIGGSGASDIVRCLGVLDTDGGGPLGPELVAGGHFATIGGVEAARIARWDGAAWHGIGGGFDGTVYALATFSAGGAGPGRLIGAGSMLRPMAEAYATPGIAQLDDGAWLPMTDGLSGQISDSIVFDPDGAGPMPPELIVTGSMWGAGTTPLRLSARWTPDGWSPIAGNDPGNGVLLTHDFDGAGPGHAELVIAAGHYPDLEADGFAFARLRGGSWEYTAPTPLLRVPAFVPAAVVHDVDGGGPQPALLVAAIVAGAGSESVTSVVGWNGSAWVGLGGALEGVVRSLVSFDPDGAGPLVPQLIAGGDFSVTTPTVCHNVARLSGPAWVGMGPGLGTAGSSVERLRVLDPDGGGPLPEQVVGGGLFYESGGDTAVRYLARWDGAAWNGFGSPPLVPWAFVPFDTDGPGPLGRELVIAGLDWGGAARPALARWDGAAWATLATELEGWAYTLAEFDFDGPGPALANLVLGGRFGAVGGEASGHFARWRVGPRADWNGDAAVNSLDIAAFVTSWLMAVTGGGGGADFDGSGGVTSADIGAFLAAWLDAIGGGC